MARLVKCDRCDRDRSICGDKMPEKWAELKVPLERVTNNFKTHELCDVCMAALRDFLRPIPSQKKEAA